MRRGNEAENADLRALIVETGASRGSLAASRALAAAGWTVGIGTPSGAGLAAASRATCARHRVPSPEDDPDAFAAAIDEIAREHNYALVFGGGDAEALALSSSRARIGALIPYAPHERVLRAHDKLELAGAAARAGLRTPAAAEATTAELRRWQPPYLVKASLHAPLAAGGGPARLNPMIATERPPAEQRAAEIRAAGSVPFLQELVQGRLLAVAVVSDPDGELVACTAQRAEATWPPRAGVSVRARSVALDPETAAGVRSLLTELGWFGLAQLQLMEPPGGHPRLIDFNGRFYGSLALAVAGGQNLPAIWAALATGREPPQETAKGDRRYQWFAGDLRRAVVERRGGLARDVLGSLRYSRGAVQSVFSLRDPAPALRRLASAPGRVLRGELRPPG